MLLAEAVIVLQEALEGDTGVPDVWTEAELEFILESALSQVNASRPRSVRDTLDLDDGVTEYVLETVFSVYKVDWLDAESKVIMQLPGRAWEIWGDNDSFEQTLWVSIRFVKDNYAVRVHGYAPWAWDAVAFPFEIQSMLIATARAEALRRLTNERARFRQWATTNPRSDVSVTELLASTNEADSHARELLQKLRIIKKPTVGRR